MTLDPKTATVAELVEQACGSLADVEDMLREIGRRDPACATSLGSGALRYVAQARALSDNLKIRHKRDVAHPPKPEGRGP